MEIIGMCPNLQESSLGTLLTLGFKLPLGRYQRKRHSFLFEIKEVDKMQAKLLCSK